MHRFYVAPENIRGGTVEIKGEEYGHLARVLRMRAGEQAVVSDGTGRDYFCVIQKINSVSAFLDIISESSGAGEPKVRIDLFQALPKSDKMDYIIQKSVELGINGIHPVITNRVVARTDTSREKFKVDRWNRIAREAAKQSERSVIPVVSDIISFGDAVSSAVNSSFCVFPYENEKIRKLRDIDFTDKNSISLFIGPEGGYDDAETELAASKGILPVTLGRRILRTETASVAVLSILMHIKGEI
jgi:16S rRNA (uracil1498-N3)-methyltransferase